MGLASDQAINNYYPLPEDKKGLVEFYHKKFKCIKAEDMYVQGNFDTSAARLVNARLNRCVNSPDLTCKSEEEITEFFRNKFIYLLYNEKSFDSEKYQHESIVKQA